MAEAPVTKALLPGQKKTADNTLDSEWKRQPPVVISTDGEQVTCKSSPCYRYVELDLCHVVRH